MTDFTKIKSEFVRKKMLRLEYTPKNVGYIGDLMDIECFVASGARNWGEAMGRHALESEYPEEYSEILKELNPGAYEALKEEEEKEKRKDKRELKRTIKEDKKEDWESRRTWELASRELP
jgi:hypothetical protein